MKIITALAICVCAWGQVNRPQVGKMVDANGAVRTVYGIASSVTIGDVEASGVVSAGCGKFCLVKTETGIVSTAGSVDAPGGPALFAFDGDGAIVWFSRARQLARWHEGVLDVCPLPDGRGSGDAETVLSIGVSGGAVRFAVRRRNGVWIINQDGSMAGSLPRATGPVMLIPGGVVYATRSEIVIGDVRLALDGVTSFSWMSQSYLQVRAGGVDYSLRIEAGHVTLFQLPGGSQ
jgi:hypothetical protein